MTTLNEEFVKQMWPKEPRYRPGKAKQRKLKAKFRRIFRQQELDKARQQLYATPENKAYRQKRDGKLPKGTDKAGPEFQYSFRNRRRPKQEQAKPTFTKTGRTLEVEAA